MIASITGRQLNFSFETTASALAENEVKDIKTVTLNNLIILIILYFPKSIKIPIKWYFLRLDGRENLRDEVLISCLLSAKVSKKMLKINPLRIT